MKRQADGKRAEITTLPILPGTLFLAGGLLLFFLIVVLLFRQMGILTLPPVIESLFQGKEEEGQEDNFAEAFLASLQGEALDIETPDRRLFDLSEEALLSVLLSCERIDSYCQTAVVSWTDGAVSFRKEEADVLYLCDGDRTYIEFASDTYGTRRYITADADRICLTEENGRRIFLRENSGFTPESEAGLPSLTRMQEMIAAAQQGEYMLALETVLQAPCIRAAFTDTLSGVTEVFHVMPDCGLILSAASYMPGESVPYYQMQTVSVLTHIDGFDPALFEIPEM